MVKRLISAAVGVVILLVVLFSNNIYLLAAGVSVITLMALYELYQATGLWKFKLLVVFGGIFCIFLIFFQFSGLSSFFGGMLIYMVALFLLLILGYKNIRFEEICIAFVLSLILPIFFL